MYKLNPLIFKQNFSFSGMFGDLGYPGFLKSLTFEIIKHSKDEIRGTIVECKPVANKKFFKDIKKAGFNPKSIKMEGNFVILEKDLIKI